jgi:hypothetical protein
VKPVELTRGRYTLPVVPDEGAQVIRAIIQYEAAPEPERYEQHNEEFSSKVDCSAFRHGKIFGSPFGDPPSRYYAEFEWADMDAFKAAAGSEAFAAAGKDAMAMGIPFTVQFVEVE